MRVLDAVLRRQSHPRLTGAAPSHTELLPLVEAAATVADHGALHPWRLIELRGAARERLGDAFVEAAGLGGGATGAAPGAAPNSAAPTSTAAETLAAKPLRAPLLIAVVAVHHDNIKVAEWEQDAAAAGVAHILSLLLDEAGWGVFWRSGGHTRAAAVHRMHGLAPNEKLLGWLYVGEVPEKTKPVRTERVDPEQFLSAL